MHRLLPLAVLIFGLPACSDSDAPATDAHAAPASPPPIADAEPLAFELAEQDISHGVTEFFFRCTDGTEFSVSYSDQSATLTLHEEQHQLRQQPSGSGTRYSDETIELYNKGDQAILMVGDLSHECAAVEQQLQRLPGPDLQAMKQQGAL